MHFSEMLPQIRLTRGLLSRRALVLKLGAIALGWVILRGIPAAKAEIETQSSADLSEVQSQSYDSGDAAPATRQSHVGGTLSFEADGYLYSPRTKTEDIYPSLIGRPQASAEAGWVELSGTALGIVQAPLSKNDSTHSYFELPEGYIATSPTRMESVQVAIGRKLEDWNRLDAEWKLGIWQPRYRWDYLRPDPVALTGLTVEVNRPLFHSVILMSPIFIPERGVNVSNDNGQLVSDSPWFVSPPNKLEILTRDTPINYNLDVPSMSKILLHPGISTMARIGDESGPWLSGGYAYKPMNQLLLSFDGKLFIDANRTAPDVVRVPISPRVVYHHLISAEAGFNTDIVSVWISSLLDRPGHDYGESPTATAVEQTVTSSVAISPGVGFKIKDDKDNLMKADFSYLYQDGGNGADRSDDSTIKLNSQSVFEQRYPFQSALRARGEVDMPNFLSSLGLRNAGMTGVSSSFLYDTKNRGSILSLDLKYFPSTRWQVNLGADVLGSQEVTSSGGSVPGDFIGRYQANDRLRAGFSYVF